jgi:NAD(P)-dependent dehydrogenase (short-subunit alcohol dehydrogenase family)
LQTLLSGIGLQASKLLRLASPESRLFLVARNHTNAIGAANDVIADATDTGSSTIEDDDNHGKDRRLFNENNLIPMACDHTSFESVRRFCAALRSIFDALSTSECKKVGIDVLCLNAAILLGVDSEVQFTSDDLELTMQTNHFAPFLIANLLLDLLNPGARVVVTSSGLHAFESFGNFEGTLNVKTGLIKTGFEMLDGSTYDHKKCYAVSKLCNVAFSQGLNRRLQDRGAIAVTFTPGLIPTSGLFRHQKLWHETVLKKSGVGMIETEEWGGVILAWMAISDQVGLHGGAYWRAPFGISRRGGKIPDDLYIAEINEEATDIKKQETLWRISAHLTGLDCGTIALVG